jgi:FAD/FMN-containing dehydrogenase
VTNWAALQETIAGEVVLPGSPEYEELRKPAIARFDDTRPRAVVRCGTPDDVAETIAFAREARLPSTPRSGGHCFAGRSSTAGIVIDVTPMSSVAVGDGVATVGAGARLGELYDALAAHGATIAGGCGPPVGIAGLVLGGGLGLMGRSHGLTCDQLLGARVVLPDGRIVDCDEDRRPDLFWALRGAGGGRFGVATSLTFRTLRPPDTTSFHLTWPLSQAPALIDAWQRWAPHAPDELAASLLVTAPADIERPPLVHVFGAMLASEADTARELGRLAAHDPASASTTHLPYRETKSHMAEHGPGDEAPGHLFIKSEYFRQALPPDAVEALVDHVAEDRGPGQSRELDFTPWGGAYNRVPTGATAFAHREELFLLKHSVIAEPSAAGAARRWLERSYAITHPYGTGGVYPNFPDSDLDDWDEAYHGTNRDRLLKVADEFLG